MIRYEGWTKNEWNTSQCSMKNFKRPLEIMEKDWTKPLKKKKKELGKNYKEVLLCGSKI